MLLDPKIVEEALGKKWSIGGMAIALKQGTLKPATVPWLGVASMFWVKRGEIGDGTVSGLSHLRQLDQPME